MRLWRKKHPLNANQRFEANCRAKTSMLIKRGKMAIRTTCERCGASKPERHHPDYNRPEIVTWLCKKCHRHLHKKESLRALIQ
jgi:transposase-like protein